ncbi:Rab geranylgeranyltransferase [Friedmanniomyces endolithicus]|nr:Rab geranylgeranyltransferase [Friedmanniomyces endolithicus]KAK1819736.1 Rab geranylgeranyltransferase [Friedmanniomyces endolithicus]
MQSHGIPRVAATTLDKSEQARNKERKQIIQYQALERDVVDRVKAKDYSDTTFQLTSQLLTQNPEYYTIWNYRRLILQYVFARELAADEEPSEQDAAAANKAGLPPPQHEVLLLIKEDLQFLIPLLKQYPKCYWIWNHRSWLLGIATKHLPAHSAVTLWQAELGLVSKMLGLDSRNFHGWGYRREVVLAIERLSSNGDGEKGSGSGNMVESEFAYTTKMIQSNLSNFSAWHYRSQLIPRLLSSRNADTNIRQDFLDAEFDLITRALYTDPYDQSLWFYHQYLMATLNPSNTQALPVLDPCGRVEHARYLEREIGSVREMLEGAEDCKYIYQALLEYSGRYLEVEAEGGEVALGEMRGWLRELRGIDPHREGRWRDLERKMGL